ncbi:MAG: zinc ribbon domain-containing protein, partial [Clostridia bacterium]|nr:zinc ribbon domain-containing protein [Clostridia bacterium]
MFCSKCGTEVKNGALFCQNCGANQNVNLKNSSSPSEILPSTKPSFSANGSVSKTTTKTAFFSKKRVFKPHQHAYI